MPMSAGDDPDSADALTELQGNEGKPPRARVVLHRAAAQATAIMAVAAAVERLAAGGGDPGRAGRAGQDVRARLAAPRLGTWRTFHVHRCLRVQAQVLRRGARLLGRLPLATSSRTVPLRHAPGPQSGELPVRGAVLPACAAQVEEFWTRQREAYRD